MPIVIHDYFERGGRDLIDLLEFAVMSVNHDVMFAYLAREYRLRPQRDAAIALFDVYCAATGPAKLSVTAMLPPRDMRLENEINQLRPQIALANDTAECEISGAGGAVPEPQGDDHVAEASVPPMPASYLFDSIVSAIKASPNSPFARAQSSFDPLKSPIKNLPGQAISSPGRYFVDAVWKPRIRPYLVSSGFWRIATIC